MTSKDTWQKQVDLLNTATILMNSIGTETYTDFNIFKKKVEVELKKQDVKLSSSEKNAILNAVSWYDATAEKVVKSVAKFSDSDLKNLLQHLDCTEGQLADYGFF